MGYDEELQVLWENLEGHLTQTFELQGIEMFT